jgi:hypothetical protein
MGLVGRHDAGSKRDCGGGGGPRCEDSTRNDAFLVVMWGSFRFGVFRKWRAAVGQVSPKNTAKGARVTVR